MPVPRGLRLDQVFRLEESRTVSNDWVVRYHNRLFQLERDSGYAPARSTVVVCEYPAGRIEIRYRNRVMHWTEIGPGGTAIALPAADSRVSPPRAIEPPAVVRTRPRRPCADHPWRQGYLGIRKDVPLWQAMDR